MFCDKVSRRRFFEKRSKADFALTWHRQQDLSEAERRGGSKASETKFDGSAYAKETSASKRRETKKHPERGVFLFCD